MDNENGKHTLRAGLRLVIAGRFAAKRSFADYHLVRNHSTSFDHLIGAGEQSWRDCNIECPGSLATDPQIELGRLLYR